MATLKRQAAHWMFEIAVAVKAFDGMLELLGGYVIAFRPGWIGPAATAWAATLLTHHPANWVGHAVAHWGHGLTVDTEHFASRYLIAHGAAKVFVAWGLFREKVWAYPTALAVFGGLIVYQLLRYEHTHSLTLAVLIIVDVAVCYLIWREYRLRLHPAMTASRV
jgi:uncharacterized membrane protein